MEQAFDLRSPSFVEELYPGVSEHPQITRSMVDSFRRPSGHSPQQIQAWLLDVIDLFDLRPTNWAKSAGVAPSTVNRFINEESPKKNLGASTIAKLSAAIPDQIEDSLIRKMEEKAKQAERFFGPDINIHVAEVAGYVSEDIQQFAEPATVYSSDLWGFRRTEYNRIHVPVQKEFSNYQIIGFAVSGHVYEPNFPEDSILICCPIKALERIPPPGTTVIVHEKLPNNQIRICVREFITDPRGKGWFVPVGTATAGIPGTYLESLPIDTALKATFYVIGNYRYIYPRDENSMEVQKSA